MANLKVTLLIKTTRNGGWVEATGNEPQGSRYYIRWYEGDKIKHKSVGLHFDEADAARARKATALKAASMGFVLKEETPQDKRYHIKDVIDAYIKAISKPDKNGDPRPAKSINATRSELERFATWSKKLYLDEITRALLERWRDELNGEYEPDTVVNKLMTVATFFKHNPLAPQSSPLPAAEFPDKKVTIPDPYTEDEFNRMMEKADYETGLLTYFFATMGMRDQEVAHARWEDIDWELGELHIVKKRDFGGKNRAALRTVPLSEDLLAELRLKGPGWLFPAPAGGIHRHFLRDVIEPLAKAAGVTPTTEKPYMKQAGMVRNDWCHRFRDTYITNQLHLNCKNMADTLMLCKRIGHSDMKTLEKYFGRLKKPYVPKLRLRKAAAVLTMERSA